MILFIIVESDNMKRTKVILANGIDNKKVKVIDANDIRKTLVIRSFKGGIVVIILSVVFLLFFLIVFVFNKDEVFLEYNNVGIKNIESDKINDTKNISIPYHRGFYKKGINSVIEYYARPFYIETKTDGNGTVTAKRTADSGEEITFTIEPKEGFMLKEVKVTDTNGNVITFTDYTFTMPSADVTIEVSFVEEVKNSETSDAIIYSAIAIIIGISFIIYNNKKKLNWLDK